MWSIFVNTHGKGIPGNNKPCDLHIEHMNRLLKKSWSQQNKECHLSMQQRYGTIGYTLLDNFDEEHHCSNVSGSHTTPSCVKDRDIIIKQIRQVFSKVATWLISQIFSKV